MKKKKKTIFGVFKLLREKYVFFSFFWSFFLFYEKKKLKSRFLCYKKIMVWFSFSYFIHDLRWENWSRKQLILFFGMWEGKLLKNMYIIIIILIHFLKNKI